MRMSTPTPATPPPTAARRRTRTPTLTSPSSARMVTPTQATPPPRMWTPPATSTRLPARLAGLNLTVTRSPYLPKPPQNQITVAEVAARLPSTISVFKSGDNTAMDLKEEKVEVITIEWLILNVHLHNLFYAMFLNRNKSHQQATILGFLSDSFMRNFRIRDLLCLLIYLTALLSFIYNICIFIYSCIALMSCISLKFTESCFITYTMYITDKTESRLLWGPGLRQRGESCNLFD